VEKNSARLHRIDATNWSVWRLPIKSLE